MRSGRFLILLVGVVWAAGCATSDDSSELLSSSGDEAEIQKTIEESGFMTLENELGANDELEYSKSPAECIFFWREVQSRPLSLYIDISGDRLTADVIVEYVWDGIWHIYEEDLSEWTKTFHYEGVAYAHLEKRHGRWKLVEVSGTNAEGEDPPVDIEWVRIQSESGIDTTFTDPLAMMDVETDILTFIRGEDVTITVSGPDSADVVLLHTPFLRRAFEYDPADGTFTGTWTAIRPSGHWRAWVDAINGDNFDGVERADRTHAWGLPYRIKE